jgi:uncharacterized protein (TIGR02266 family)
MADREHQRMPYGVQVEFRTPSSFLITYSVNLSRGGLFLETEAEVPEGSPIAISLAIPGAGAIELTGVVMWRRGLDSPDGPPGMGIEFADIAPQLGGVIDRLVSSFHGMQILVLSGDRQDRQSLARSIKSIISTAEILQAADPSLACTLMTNEIDLAVVDVDFDVDGGLATLRAAKAVAPAVPTVALTSTAKLREHARAAGADEIAANPPSFTELQVVLVRALGKPVAVRATS